MKIFEKLNKKSIQFLPLMYENISNGFPELPSEVFRKRIDSIQFAYPVSMTINEPLITNHISEFVFTDDIILDEKQSDAQTFCNTLHANRHIYDFNKIVHDRIREYKVKEVKGLTIKYHRLWEFSPMNKHFHNITSDSISIIRSPYRVHNRLFNFRSIYEIAEAKIKHKNTEEEKKESADEVF